MTNKNRNNLRLSLTFIICLILILVISRFIPFPLRISTQSEVFPKAKWLLIRGNNGQIISCLIDYEQGRVSEYKITQFERGEFISVNFKHYLNNKKELEKGDTVVVVRSSNVVDRLIQAEGELDVAIANLNSQQSSEKEPLIREAENRLKYTLEKIKEQQVLYDRTKQLFEKGFSSKEEYELQKLNLDLLNIESEIYTAQIENLKTGAKPEVIKLLESQINSAKSKLDFFRDLNSSLVITSPIKGKIVPSLSPDTLLSLVDYEQVVLHTPIKTFDLIEFKEGQIINTTFSNLDSIYFAKVLSIDKEIKLINGQQAIFLSLLIDNKRNEFMPGMIVENLFNLRTITFFDYLIKLIVN